MLTPFHAPSIKNVVHHKRSERMPALSRYCLPIRPIFEHSSNIRRRNVLPGMTTWAACPSFPINDTSSFGVQDLFPCHCWSSSFNSMTLDSGSHTSAASVSSSNPRKVIQVVGPPTCSPLLGIPADKRHSGAWKGPLHIHLSLTSPSPKSHPDSESNHKFYSFLVCDPLRRIRQCREDLRGRPQTKGECRVDDEAPPP